MTPKILSLHHVTATVGDAQVDLDFYAGHLGLRLVKQTVNFDNHHVFHFYYGNERGTPGTIMTTFPYKGMGVPVGRKGAGQITVTSFSVPLGSLPAWRKRLAARGVTTTPEATRFGEEFIAFQDPSGLDLELVATDRDARLPWVTGEVYSEMAIRGVHSVTLSIRAPEASIGFLTGLLGWSIVERNEQRTRLGVEEGGPGQRLDILHTPDAQPALNGLGTVHHLAMAIGTPEEQLAARAELIARGYHVTEVRDRQYFLSIYFREPGGVLYEIATMAPGFAVDEEASRLGRALKLPPWEEPHRAMIEAGLPAVSFPAP